MRTYGIYDLMVIADADGRIVAANTVDAGGDPLDTSSLIGASVAGEPWFQEALSLPQGRSSYQDVAPDPLVGEIAGEPTATLRFAAPVRDAGGQVVRVWSTARPGTASSRRSSTRRWRRPPPAGRTWRPSC